MTSIVEHVARITRPPGPGAVVLPQTVIETVDATPVPLFGRIDDDRGAVRIWVEPDHESQIGYLSTDNLCDTDDLVVVTQPKLRATYQGRTLDVIVRDERRYYARVQDLPEVDCLRHRTVAIVGLGSVGSDIAVRLARLGVQVVGFDPDVLSTENLIRWGLPCNEADLGRPKAHVLVDRLAPAIPESGRFHASAIDVVRQAQAFRATLTQYPPDLIIGATDTRDSRRVVNAAAADMRIPALFVTLSDGAASVRMEVVEDAYHGPCHLCATLAEGYPSGNDRTSRTPYAADAIPVAAVPALPVDVSLGATLATRVALRLLSGQDWRPYFDHGSQTGNVTFIALQPEWWVFKEPLERMTYAVEMHPECPCCGKASTPWPN